MSLRRTLAITTRVLAQFRHDRRTLAILFVAPVFILWLFSLLFSGQSDPSRLGVVNLDDGPLGAAIVEELGSSDLVTLDALSATDAEAQLEDGGLDAYLLLPAELSANAQHGTLGPELHLRGTDPGAESMVARALSQALPGAIGAVLEAGPLPVPIALPTIDVETSTLFGNAELSTIDLLGSAFIGLLVFFLVYVVTSVAFLRERSQGTLERLMASPLKRSEIVLGYMIGFTLIAFVQAAEVLVFGIWLVGIYNAGNLALIFGMEALLALGAVNLGIFLSTFARSEFQAVQFIPLVITPMMLLSGVIVPVSSEPDWLQVVSSVLPLTYAVEGLKAVMLEGRGLESARVQLDVAVLAGFALLALVAASATLRRRVD
jgi:ABC-2 type transport system permease protein